MTKKKRVNTKKKNNKKIKKIDSSFDKEILKTLYIMVGVLLFLGIFYFITVGIVSKDENSDNSAETTIQYDQILAGSSFNMKDSEYFVIYYDFDDEELAELSNRVYGYNYSGSKRVYTVDMSDGFNKKYITEDESNKNPESVSQLAIKGPTLIKFIDGKCVEYVEGQQEIINYLG